MQSRHTLTSSERSRLLPFVVASGDISPRDQRDLMERPFFSLSKTKRTTPILYATGDVRVEVFGMPEHGMATIWDADVLIWTASQIVDAENLGLTTSRFLRFTPYQLLTGIGRQTGARDYGLLRAALARLQSTVVATTIRNGQNWRRHQFSWITEWEICASRKGRAAGVEIVIPEWLYRGVTDRSLVLAIDPAYFRLTGGIERWLYRVARKHAGRQSAGWVFEIAHLHRKSGSLARAADFAFDIRRIATRQPLPGYCLRVEHDGGRELLRIRPTGDLSTHPVDKTVSPIGTSGVRSIGTSGVPLSGLQACKPQLSLWPETAIPALNLSNLESNSFVDGKRRSADNASQPSIAPSRGPGDGP
ncbi:replication initiator protein A [Acetobacter okinawensis]|uniref:replication initiator protein A n=1 Tax=Acetobacter okinawensis TaxID=1076594 RepID=UPI001BA6FD9F|nr:replication initiator protein A [Acetobacter okinawensis]MBS0989534.1 replication initiator protein A [Acetobacter okinawensis]